MLRIPLVSVTILVAVLSGQSSLAQPPRPPVAEIKPVELTEHGNTRVDNYFWLRERDNPKVLDYLKAENAYTDAMMAESKPLEEKLYRETIARIKQDDSTVPYLENGYEYWTRFAEGQEYPIYCRRLPHAGAADEVMIDVNELAKGESFCHVSGVEVNRQNNLAAFAIDTIGRNIYTLRIKELASGKLLDEEVPAMAGNLVWAEDGKTLFYTRQDPETLRPYQVYRHVVGTNPEADVLVYEEKDDTFNCSVSKTRSKKYIIITSEQTLSTECRYLDATNPAGEFQVFEPRRRDHEYSDRPPGRSLLHSLERQGQELSPAENRRRCHGPSELARSHPAPRRRAAGGFFAIRRLPGCSGASRRAVALASNSSVRTSRNTKSISARPRILCLPRPRRKPTRRCCAICTPR